MKALELSVFPSLAWYATNHFWSVQELVRLATAGREDWARTEVGFVQSILCRRVVTEFSNEGCFSIGE